MRQFVLPRAVESQGIVSISGSDAHYLRDVLRFRPGDSFHGVDPTGAHFHCTIEEAGASTIDLRVIPRGNPTVGRVAITLYQCLPKGRKLDDVIRRCTEAGVSAVVPLYSDHTVVRLTSEEVPGKVDRWRRVAKEAVQQSGSPHPVRVDTPIALDDAVAKATGASASRRRLFMHQAPLAQAGLHGYLADSPTSVDVVIGPEGGLSDREVSLLKDAEFEPVYLGPHVLRTETAGLYAVAAVQTILLERSAWTLRSSSKAEREQT